VKATAGAYGNTTVTAGTSAVKGMMSIALTAAAGGSPPGQASNPSPANGATSVGVTTDLSWTAGSGATSHDVYFGTAASPPFIQNQTGTTYDTGTMANSTTYRWKIDEKNASGTTTGVVWSFTTAAGGGLPSPWVSQDIGSPSAAGSATYASGTFTVNGDGADISGTSDSFQFVYQPVSGNCTIIARVVSLTNVVQDWAKAGIMIRESLNADSTFALGNFTTNVANTVHSWTLLHRDTTGGSATQTVWGTDQVTPYWLRVVRSGSSFSGYVSSNGSSWTLITTATINMASNVYVGMAVTSHAAGTLSTATFDNVSVTTP
jgi:regulation of enolase protein 1 (concanavalin A-like superfamily)